MEAGTLSGWKAIAAHFGRGERTVKRWAAERRMPVHRVPGGTRSPVYAFTSELDVWIAAARGVEDEEEQPSPPKLAMMGGNSRRWAFKTTYGFALLLVLAGSIASSIVLNDGKAVPKSLARTGSPSIWPPALEDTFLQANYNLQLRTPRSLRRASNEFSYIILKQPTLAKGYAGLAQTYLLEREYAGLPDDQAFEKARVAAMKAVHIDPMSAPAHRVLAFIAFWRDIDIPVARQEFTRALELAPGDALTRHWYATALSGNGEFKPALQQIEQARMLEPQSTSILADYAMISYLAGYHNRALGLLQEIVLDRPDQLSAYSYLAEFAFERRDYRAAVHYWAAAARVRRDPEGLKELTNEQVTLAAHGSSAFLAALLEQARLHVQRSGTGFYQLARFDALTGDYGGSMDALGTAFEQREVSATSISCDPVFNALRAFPRFRRWIDRKSLSV